MPTMPLPPAEEVLAVPASDHEEQYADDPTALSAPESGPAPEAPAQDDWPLGVDGQDGELEASVEQAAADAHYANQLPTCFLSPHLRDLRERVRLTSAQLAAATEDRKECKKAHQEAIAALMKALDESASQGGASGPPSPTAAAAPAPAPEDAWKSFELAKLDLSPSIITALAENGLETMGQLCDYSANGGLLTDLKKIGKGKAEKIENACERFWAEHPEFGEGAGEVDASDEAPDSEPEEEELTEQEAAGLAGEGEEAEGVSDEAYEGL